MARGINAAPALRLAARCHLSCGQHVPVYASNRCFRMRTPQHAVLAARTSRTVAPQPCDPPGLCLQISQSFFKTRPSFATWSMYVSASLRGQWDPSKGCDSVILMNLLAQLPCSSLDTPASHAVHAAVPQMLPPSLWFVWGLQCGCLIKNSD
jgi:hypothetical protein